MKTPTFIGQVVRRNDLWNAVKVKITKMKLDKYLLMYFNTHKHVWASEPDKCCKDGDIVLVKLLQEPQSDKVRYSVKEVVFAAGNIIDPITGRRCRGPEFADSQKYVYNNADGEKAAEKQ